MLAGHTWDNLTSWARGTRCAGLGSTGGTAERTDDCVVTRTSGRAGSIEAMEE